MSFIERLLIAVVAFAIFSACAQVCRADDYKPMTDGDVAAYIARVGEAGVYADIKRLDAIENGPKKVELPTMVFLKLKTGETMAIYDKPLKITLGGYLITEYTLPGAKATLDTPQALPYAIGGIMAGGLLTGILVWNLKK
jgi:hypothetical protein